MAVVCYEIRKVFLRTGSQIAAAICAIVVILFGVMSVNSIFFVDDQGNHITGIQGARLLAAAKEPWEGPLTAERLALVIETNQKENASPQALSEDITQNNISYGRKQGYSDILLLLSDAFGDFSYFNYYAADRLTADDADNFYRQRVLSLTEWLYTKADSRFSPAEKEFLIQQFENVRQPLYYAAADGWDQLFYTAPSLITVLAIMCGFLVSGIFSCEKQWKCDAVFFSSFHGRKKACKAKIGAGVAIATIIYWASMLLCSGIILGCMGAGGANTMIQAQFFGSDSFYNITVWQEFFLILFGGYAGCLFFVLLAMLVSAKSGSAIFAVTIPFILILLPQFLSNMEIPKLDRLLGILPDQLLSVSLVLRGYNLYDFAGKIVGALPILLVVYPALCLVLLPVIYTIYKKTVVR